MEGREPPAVEYQESLAFRAEPNSNREVTVLKPASAGSIWRKRAPLKASNPSPRVAMKSSGSTDPAAIPTDIEPGSAGGNSMPVRYWRWSAPLRSYKKSPARALTTIIFL